MIRPLTINAFHTVQLLYQKNWISIYQVAGISGICNTFTIAPVIASVLKEVVNITVHVPIIFQPSPLIYMMHGGCIDSAIRFSVPWDMINKFCDDKAISANI